jgi:DegV family protein with EDD domain
MLPGKRIAIVTDSTADLPPELVERYQIHVIPQNIIWGGQTYRDRVDMDSPAFYERLRTDREFPKTSQPSVGAFHEAWQQAAPSPATPVLSIHISGALSGTVATAETAKGMLPERTIEIVDTRSATLGLGYMVLAAARAAEQGQGLAECAAAARALVARMNLFFVLETLEFLHRGGRIGGAARLLGTMLNLKPLLQVVDGKVEPLDRVRTRAKALERLLDTARTRIGGRPVHMGLLHVAAAADMARLADTLRAQFNCVELLVCEATPTIGAHVGPGTLGMVFYTE